LSSRAPNQQRCSDACRQQADHVNQLIIRFRTSNRFEGVDISERPEPRQQIVHGLNYEDRTHCFDLLIEIATDVYRR
jgi:hypothetical protein